MSPAGSSTGGSSSTFSHQPLTAFQQTQQYFNNNQSNSPTTTTPSSNRLGLILGMPSSPDPISPMLQARNRLGLLLPLQSDLTATSSAAATPTDSAATPSRSKQGSPFYAEPADALGNVIRRSQRSAPSPASHRHSEPAKGGGRLGAATTFCQVLSPIESEKSTISGSLDELKRKNQRKARGRLDPWPLDSSWEFMGDDGGGCDEDAAAAAVEAENDYDTDANWKTGIVKSATADGIVHAMRADSRPMTVHQIIAKRMPELGLPDMIRQQSPDLGRNGGGQPQIGSAGKYNRISSYDNVERHGNGYGTSAMCHGSSAHSDDGTVFSEPWDSSQWDSFLPHDGKFVFFIIIKGDFQSV